MENTNKLNQSANKGLVVGKLKDKKIEFKNSKAGKPMAMGTITVQVEDKHGVGEVRIKVMQMAQRKDGGENGLYKALQTINSEYKTITTHGESIADTISVEVSLEDNSHYVKAEDVVKEYVQLKAGIIKRVEADAPHCSKMQIGGYLAEMLPQEDGSMKVKIISITFRGDALPVDLEIPKELVAPFSAKYYAGCTTSLNYAMINTVVIEQEEEEVAFGESIGMTTEKRVKKNLVFGGTNVEANGYTAEGIQQALKMRELELNKKLEEGRAKNTSQGGTANGGFGAGFGQAGFGTGATVETTISAGFGTGGFTTPTQPVEPQPQPQNTQNPFATNSNPFA